MDKNEVVEGQQVVAEQEDNGLPAMNPANEIKRYKRIKLLLVGLLVLGLVGAGAWYFVYKPSGSVSSNKTDISKKTESNATPKSLSPVAVAYSHTVEQSTAVGGCGVGRGEVFWRPVGGGDRNKVLGFGDNSILTHYGLFENKVFVIVEPACGGKEGLSVWYSQDAGKTYSVIYRGNAPSGDNQDQVTSAIFSSSKNSILIAVLSADRSKNTIMEIVPKNKVAKELFSVTDHGVFLQTYNEATNQVTYFAGCYNCDGNSYGDVRSHDLAKKTDEILLDSGELMVIKNVVSADHSKILQLRGASNPTSNDLERDIKPPYTIGEIDIAKKSFKPLVTLNEDDVTDIGYGEVDGAPYYSVGKSVYSIGGNGKSARLIEARETVRDVLFVGKDTVLVSIGGQDFSLLNYTPSTGNFTKILDGDAGTRLFGVTLD